MNPAHNIHHKRVTVLLLGAGPYYVPLIHAAKKTGYRIVCVDRDPNAPGQQVADAFAPIDFSDAEKVLAFARQEQIQAIVPLNDYGVQTAALVAKEMGLIGISTAAAQKTTDKYLMRQAWQAQGLPNPAYQLIQSLAEAEQFAQTYGFPVILKPANSLGGGSRGVKVADEMRDLVDAFDFAHSAYTDGAVLIEACVTGVEHSAEVLVIEGLPYVLTLSDKVKTPYPYRVDEKVIYPSQISEDAYQSAAVVIQKAVLALGITTGAAHVELCTTPNGPVLFELGARCGGGATAEPITAYVTGYPYFQALIRLLAGEAIEPPINCTARPCIYGFFTVENQEAQTLKPDSRFIDWQVFPKETMPSLTRQGSDRLGYYIFQGDLRDLKAGHDASVSV